MASRPRRRMPLPQGKNYHFNVIYNNAKSKLSRTDDTRLALEVTEHFIERAKGWGYDSCYYTDRDALPGQNIFSELFEVIDKSEYTVVILTKGFLANCWARYCQMSAFKSLLDESHSETSRLIPVLIGVTEKELIRNLSLNRYVSFTLKDWKTDNKEWNKVQQMMKDRTYRPDQTSTPIAVHPTPSSPTTEAIQETGAPATPTIENRPEDTPSLSAFNVSHPQGENSIPEMDRPPSNSQVSLNSASPPVSSDQGSISAAFNNTGKRPRQVNKKDDQVNVKPGNGVVCHHQQDPQQQDFLKREMTLPVQQVTIQPPSNIYTATYTSMPDVQFVTSPTMREASSASRTVCLPDATITTTAAPPQHHEVALSAHTLACTHGPKASSHLESRDLSTDLPKSNTLTSNLKVLPPEVQENLDIKLEDRDSEETFVKENVGLSEKIPSSVTESAVNSISPDSGVCSPEPSLEQLDAMPYRETAVQPISASLSSNVSSTLTSQKAPTQSAENLTSTKVTLSSSTQKSSDSTDQMNVNSSVQHSSTTSPVMQHSDTVGIKTGTTKTADMVSAKLTTTTAIPSLKPEVESHNFPASEDQLKSSNQVKTSVSRQTSGKDSDMKPPPSNISKADVNVSQTNGNEQTFDTIGSLQNQSDLEYDIGSESMVKPSGDSSLVNKESLDDPAKKGDNFQGDVNKTSSSHAKLEPPALENEVSYNKEELHLSSASNLMDDSLFHQTTNAVPSKLNSVDNGKLNGSTIEVDTTSGLLQSERFTRRRASSVMEHVGPAMSLFSSWLLKPVMHVVNGADQLYM